MGTTNTTSLSRRCLLAHLGLGFGGLATIGEALAASPSAPALLLARDAPIDVDPAGYLVSEKFDGVRALWDGQTLRFRSGHTIAAPAWFIDRLPARVHFVTALPKTRSGKMLRRALQAVCEQRDPGDLTTMDDPVALQQIRDLVAAR